eukprot:scaffold6804_cov57-Cyclotella_meneghiniana.AAC.10
MGYYNYYRSEIWKYHHSSLLSSGWSWKIGSGLMPMTDYYYIKPDKKVNGGVANLDFFVDRASLEEYMKRCYGWVCKDGKPEEEMLHCDEPITNQKVKQKGFQGQDSQ